MTQPSRAKLALVMHALSLYISLTNPQAMMGWFDWVTGQTGKFSGQNLQRPQGHKAKFFY